MAATPSGPARVVAPPEWRAIDFISDLHLTEGTQRTFAQWSEFLHGTHADAIFILGDLFEAWVGDDSRLEGFEARGAATLTSAAQRRPIYFMVGNRDFLLGAEMLTACGMQALEDPTLLCAFGEKVLLAHGDALCIDDLPYQQLRRVVRDPNWQRSFLARPLPERRAMARALRDESERHKSTLKAGEWIDVDPTAAVAALASAGTTTLVHGHTHRPASEEIAPGYWRHVLSDWDLDGAGPSRAEIMRWQGGPFMRLSPDEAIRRGP
ncbi:MAG: UDP-2,3-diacylglucosamine diphosphatase [Caldimonas sp.]